MVQPDDNVTLAMKLAAVEADDNEQTAAERRAAGDTPYESTSGIQAAEVPAEVGAPRSPCGIGAPPTHHVTSGRSTPRVSCMTEDYTSRSSAPSYNPLSSVKLPWRTIDDLRSGCKRAPFAEIC